MGTPGNRPLRKGDHPKYTKTGKNSRRAWIPSDTRLYGGQMNKSRDLYTVGNTENFEKINWDE